MCAASKVRTGGPHLIYRNKANLRSRISSTRGRVRTKINSARAQRFKKMLQGGRM